VLDEQWVRQGIQIALANIASLRRAGSRLEREFEGASARAGYCCLASWRANFPASPLDQVSVRPGSRNRPLEGRGTHDLLGRLQVAHHVPEQPAEESEAEPLFRERGPRPRRAQAASRPPSSSPPPCWPRIPGPGREGGRPGAGEHREPTARHRGRQSPPPARPRHVGPRAARRAAHADASPSLASGRRP
jgi:hypothetical protein